MPQLRDAPDDRRTPGRSDGGLRGWAVALVVLPLVFVALALVTGVIGWPPVTPWRQAVLGVVVALEAAGVALAWRARRRRHPRDVSGSGAPGQGPVTVLPATSAGRWALALLVLADAAPLYWNAVADNVPSAVLPVVAGAVALGPLALAGVAVLCRRDRAVLLLGLAALNGVAAVLVLVTWAGLLLAS